MAREYRRPLALTLHRSAVRIELMATARGIPNDGDHRKANGGRLWIKLCHRPHPLAHLLLFTKTRI